MKLPKPIPTKLILTSALILGIGAGATLYMVQNPTEEQASQFEPVVLITEQQAPVVEETSTESIAKATLEAAPELEAIETSTTSTQAAEGQESAPTEPVEQEFPFAADMRAAGIEEKDFETVYALVLAPYGWRMMPTPENNFVWRLAYQLHNIPTLEKKLASFKKYIELTYGGDFSKALETARTRGNF
ncbi:hypothetical protein [Glutamicibacter halophytocola]|uniref:hypothetical protein n=1 Tax=Glutamicibacter halophytocola TaxID=1933880 RepID=UPI0015C55C28|nr:hypothetical protein [Glutamicibacter halophytocola]NQD42377.1 hypothetical protein [Glutamicibacter halophytocola]